MSIGVKVPIMKVQVMWMKRVTLTTDGRGSNSCFRIGQVM